MFENFEVDNKIDVPIYRQLTDMVRVKVNSGEFLPGLKLPTVRALSNMLGVAQGTVKRAYDELESLGVVEKAQGKGTFISEAKSEHVPTESRKDRAMEAIDSMFDELEEMGFSMTEIKIFLELKEREREARREKIKIALIECNPEVLYNLVDQMRSPGLDIYPFLLADVKAYPYKVSEDMDLVITTATHFDELLDVVPNREKLMRIALSLTTASVHDMLMIPPKSQVGVASISKRFGEMIHREMDKYNLNVEKDAPILFDECDSCEDWISAHDYILLPESYEKYVEKKMKESLEKAQKKGKIILCSYKMDQGSAIQLEEKIKGIKR